MPIDRMARGPGPADRPDLPLPPGADAARCAAAARCKRWRWVGAFGPDGDGVRGARLDRRHAGRVVGGVGRRAPARAHAPARRPGADGARARALRRARAALRGGRGRRGRLAARRAVHLDPQAGAACRSRGTVLGRPFEGRGFVDDTAGYHARGTAWRWSAGVGVAESGARGGVEPGRGRARRLQTSERTVWVDGTPHDGRAAAVRARPLRGRRPALRARRRARRTASACCCWPPSTRCRSGASAARCRTPGRCARAGE